MTCLCGSESSRRLQRKHEEGKRFLSEFQLGQARSIHYFFQCKAAEATGTALSPPQAILEAVEKPQPPTLANDLAGQICAVVGEQEEVAFAALMGSKAYSYLFR